MTATESSFDDRHLSGKSFLSESPQNLVSDSYDYILVGTSWDERSVVVTACEMTGKVVQVLRPENQGTSGRRAAHDAAIGEWAQRTGELVEYIDGASEDVDVALQRIQDRVQELRAELRRPVTILVDLSATVRYVTLGLVAFALNDEVAAKVDIFYAEADYVESEETVDATPSTAGNSWEAMAVPGLEGDWYPARSRHFLVSAGFHAQSAARLAERWDPNRVSVLLPRPALKPEYEVRTAEANASWMQRFRVDEDHQIEAPPADAINTWSKLADAPNLAPENENTYCLLCGTKPHSLALTLWALARQSPAVLYVRPTVHAEQSVRASGRVWLYRVWDRTLLNYPANTLG
jgi:hypothetical protein